MHPHLTGISPVYCASEEVRHPLGKKQQSPDVLHFQSWCNVWLLKSLWTLGKKDWGSHKESTRTAFDHLLFGFV